MDWHSGFQPWSMEASSFRSKIKTPAAAAVGGWNPALPWMLADNNSSHTSANLRTVYQMSKGIDLRQSNMAQNDQI